MKEQIVSWETAKLLKKLGFNWSTFYWYDRNQKLHHNPIKNYNKESFSYSAPTQCQAQKFLKEKHNFDIEIRVSVSRNKYYVLLLKDMLPLSIETELYFDTYEEALEMGLRKILKHLLRSI